MERLSTETLQPQFDLGAAQREAEAAIAGGSTEYMNMMTSSLLTEAGGIQIGDQVNAEGALRLALGVAAEAQKAGITAQTTAEGLRSVYDQLAKGATAYRQTEGFDPAVAAAKDALAIGVWHKMNTPVATIEAR